MATIFFWTPVNGVNTNPNLSPQGTITIDGAANDGRGTLQVGGGAPNSPDDLRFCANVDSAFTTPPPNCSEVMNYTTDGNGAATIHFQMAPPGAFSGVFVIFKNGTAVYGPARIRSTLEYLSMQPYCPRASEATTPTVAG